MEQVAEDKGAGVVDMGRDKVIGDVVGRFPPFPLRDGRKKVWPNSPAPPSLYAGRLPRPLGPLGHLQAQQ